MQADNSTKYPRFIVDEMLGKLARWLRILKFDTKYAKEERENNPLLSDSSILKIALLEGRILVTRDKELYAISVRHGAKAILIKTDNLEEQLLAVMRESGVNEIPLFNSSVPLRCAVCNTPLIKVPKDAVLGKVPQGIYARFNNFWVCPKCGKVYWPGSHWEAIVKLARRVRKKLQSGWTVSEE